MNEETLSLNGQVVHLWRAGRSDEWTALLLHGGLGDAACNWRETLPILAERGIAAVAPDLPGFGGSAPIPAQVDALLAWLDELREAVVPGRCLLVGHALGALVARLYAAQKPVDGLVLVSGGALPRIPPLLRLPLIGEAVFAALARSTMRDLDSAVAAPVAQFDDFTACAQANQPGFARLMRALAGARAGAVAAPTLLLWGARDTINPPARAEPLRAAIPGAGLQIIADCGHLPQIETPDVLAWQVEQFSKRIERPARPDLPGVGRLS